jgi:3-hydroxyacyl-[acyl-carrier-protein] dehydratase
MPPRMLFDISGIDLNRVIFDSEAIRLRNPQRGDMEPLDAIVWVDTELGLIIGYKDVRADEFWAPGHIPGRPILPGVLMIEAAAQLCSFYTREFEKWTGFIGFGGAEEIRFRMPVVPGQRLYIMAKKTSIRHGRLSCKTQGLVNGQNVFEATIIGTQV